MFATGWYLIELSGTGKFSRSWWVVGNESSRGIYRCIYCIDNIYIYTYMHDLFYIHNLTMDLPSGNIWAGNVSLGFRLFLGPWELYDLYEQVATAGSFLAQNPRGCFQGTFFSKSDKRNFNKIQHEMNSFLLQTHPLFHNFYLIHPNKKTNRCEAMENLFGSSRTFVTPFPSLQISYHELRLWRSVVPFTCALIIQQPWRLGGWGLDGMAEDGSRNANFVKDVGSFQISDIFLELDCLPR